MKTKISIIAEALKNWVPYRLEESSNEPLCRWIYLGDAPITEPFFSDTIAKCRQLSPNSKLHRSVGNTAILEEWAEQMEVIPPAAFIFHVSRCGSTLVSQLLGINAENIVLSEVPFFDELLRFGFRQQRDVLSLLKAAVGLYSARRNEKQKRVFIKTDSWHIHFYHSLRQLYPHTPFIFLYRNPAEVLLSQQKNRGMHAVPGVVEPAIFNLDAEHIIQLSLDGYLAKVLEGYFQKIIDILQTDRKTIAVNYNQGAIAVMEQITSFAGVVLMKEEIAAMQQRSEFHGKYPGQAFSETSLQEPSPLLLEEAVRLYTEAEKIRIANF
ncbi:MAG: sulfotransferase family protein [Chitinophagaceae bacterium]|nr:sulfotransferase family protein [Chitinophagaceae bacterium]